MNQLTHIIFRKFARFLGPIGLFILFVAPRATAVGEVELKYGTDTYDLEEFAEVFEDATASVTFEVLRQTPENFRFEPVPSNTAKGFTDSRFWIRFKITNTDHDGDLWCVRFKRTLTDIKLFKVDTDQAGGQELIPWTRLHYPVYEFKLPKGQSTIIYGRLGSMSPLDLGMKVSSTKELLRENSIEQYLSGIYYGAATVLVIFNIFMFLSVKDRSYLYYILFQSNLIITLAIRDDLFDHWFPLGDFFWRRHLNLFANISLSLIIVFARSFLQTKSELPKFDVWIKSVLAFSLILVFFELLPGFPTLWLTDVNINIVSVTSIAAGILCLAKGLRQARFYVAAWTCLLVSSVAWTLTHKGIIESNFFTEHILHLGSILEIILFSFAIVDRVNLLKEAQSKAAEQVLQYKAVSETAQMLAHDLRRPFTMLDMMMYRLGNAKTIEETRSLTTRYRQDLDTAVKTVKEMMRDVATSQKTDLNKHRDVRIEGIIIQSLKSVFYNRQDSEVSISYENKSLRSVRGDEHKLVRVFANILDNAVDAMNSRGKIWINVQDSKIRQERIQVVIGNNGPPIESKDRDNVFNIFFTKGKSDGTGLGLAFSRKVIDAHNGEISCRSTQSATEFAFDLPSGEVNATASDIKIPLNGQSVHDEISSGKVDQQADMEACSENFRDLSLPLVAVVDDNIYVLEAWQAHCKDAVVICFDSPEKFWSKIKKNPEIKSSLACVVTDYHFDGSDTNGRHFAQHIKETINVPVFLASDSEGTRFNVPACVDASIEKRPHTWSELKELI